MEAQHTYLPLLTRIFSGFNPSPSVFVEVENLLKKQCTKNKESTLELLSQFNAYPIVFISFHAFCKIVRLLRRTVISLKSQEHHHILSRYILRFAPLYFSQPHSVAKNESFDQYLQLFTGLQLEANQKLGDFRQILVYLASKKYSKEWADALIQKINSEVLVDKKSQQLKYLKLNRYFSTFIVQNFDKFIPSLERLLVRSESNIEIWQQFLSSVEQWKGIDSFVLPLLNKIKGLFSNNPETGIKIVVALTRHMTEEKSIKQVITFISGLISAEPNIKKKIVFIKMLKGILQSLKSFHDKQLSNIFAQQILVVITNSLIKFSEEQEFNILCGILQNIFPLISDPKDDIAKAGKVYLKNQNKYIFTLFAIIVSSIYRKEQIQQLPSVKQVFAHYKSQLNSILKLNWQTNLPVLLFLAETNIQYTQNLKQQSPLFKISCLALNKVEKKIAFKLLIKYMEHTKATDQDEIFSNFYVVLALLLEEIKDKETWEQFLSLTTPQERVKLVSKAIFPLSIFPCNELKINKGNSFVSLLLFIYKSLKNEKVELSNANDFIRSYLAYCKLRPSFKTIINIEDNQLFQESLQHFTRSSLFDHENDEENTVKQRERTLIESLSNDFLSYNQQFLTNLLELFTKQQYYQQNLQFLLNFQEQILKSLNIVKQQLNQLMNNLADQSVHKIEEEKPKKVYIGVSFEVKMMSQQQVKAQKYRKHFLKMLSIFDKIIKKLLIAMNSNEAFNKLWRNNLKSLLKMTKFPEHRMSVLRLVKKSCIFTAWFNRKSSESKLFIKYSEFIGQFFSFRHSQITPSVRIMTHCETFFRQLLSIPFETNNNYLMLSNNNDQFSLLLINEMCQYLLENMQFDVNLKKHAIVFYHKCWTRNISFNNEDLIFTYLTVNINILSNSQFIQPVLLYILKRINKDRIKELFSDILNYIQLTKKVILRTLLLNEEKYKPEFEEFIKLKILALEYNEQISKNSAEILSGQGELKRSILTFNMKNFVRKNSKQTIEKLCLFIKEQINAENSEEIFKMVIKASEELYDQGFDQEGLQMFPFFLTINIDYITQPLYRPIFQLLILKFTSRADFGTLSKLSVEVGINIVKKFAGKHAQKLLLVLQSFINKATGVSNIIYLGVLAPYLEGNKNLQMIEKRITELFKTNNKEAQQRSISKCMPDLMSFFKKPEEIVEGIFINIGTMDQQYLQVGQSYLFTGLLKGIGYKTAQQYLQKVLSHTYITKTKMEKLGRIHLVEALVDNFGRAIEFKAVKIISLMIGFMADNLEEIRNVARRVGQSLIVKMSSFSVKILLPELLKGLEQEQNWRVKISYIWILGIMANCSARQLQTSLPIIVPTLSTCLSNAHPTIREKASQALNLIGETIKNPQISQAVDILIEALENPFENSQRALDILLKTSFHHYIDPPSLSMIIPILDYCLRGRSTELKAGSCQVIGSIVELIANPYDLLPYLRIIVTGLKVALCDPLSEIRCIASMAVGKIANKIGIKQAQIYFRFIIDIIQSPTSNTTERQGAAQAYAEIICSQTYQYFEESLYKIFEKLNSIRHSQKEGYILVFLYVPSIRTQQFEGFIKEVNENMYAFVSDEEQNIRNSSMMVQKVLINTYCLTHTDLLLDPLCDGVFQNNWKKRNSAIILIGEMLNIIKSHMYNTRTSDKNYAYYRGLMAVYVIKDDDLQMPRLTANQVWNTYIENTPKTIKLGLNQLVKMWTKWTHSANGVVFKNIVAFSGKYGENYFTEIIEQLQFYITEPEHQIGVFEVLAQFIKRLNAQFLSREAYKQSIRDIFSSNLYTVSEQVRPALAKCLALYIDKLHEQKFFEDLIYSAIDKMDDTDEANEQYTKNLHLLKDLLQTNSNKVVDRVINKIMQSPMSEFKIEVITNNAEKLANYLYSHFKVPATEIFIDEIYTLVENKSKENRLNLIIYCLEQVSLRLNNNNKDQFVTLINHNINKQVVCYINNPTNPIIKKTLKIFINMLLFFMNSINISQINDLDTLIGQLSPVVFFEDEELQGYGHKIYLILLSDNKNQRTVDYIKQIVVSLENQLTPNNQEIWTNQVTFKDYVTVLVKGIAYGKEEIMEECLDLIEFLMNHSSRALVEKEILRIVGPIIRICNYPLSQKQKIRIMELLISILKQSYKIDAYNNQILSICLRLLQEFKSSEDIMRVVADTYLALLIGTSLKQELMMSILNRLRTFGANLVNSFYYLVKSIVIQKVEIPKQLFEKIYEESMIILLTNEGKLPIKALYYCSKIAARLSIVLGKPFEKAEVNLKGLVCSYENVIHYLHFAYYKKVVVKRLEAIQIFLKESNRQKIHYLLKSLKLCNKNAQESRKLYSLEYVKNLVPETIIGFDDINDLLDYFESENIEVEPVEQEETKADLINQA